MPIGKQTILLQLSVTEESDNAIKKLTDGQLQFVNCKSDNTKPTQNTYIRWQEWSWSAKSW